MALNLNPNRILITLATQHCSVASVWIISLLMTIDLDDVIRTHPRLFSADVTSSPHLQLFYVTAHGWRHKVKIVECVPDLKQSLSYNYDVSFSLNAAAELGWWIIRLNVFLTLNLFSWRCVEVIHVCLPHESDSLSKCVDGLKDSTFVVKWIYWVGVLSHDFVLIDDILILRVMYFSYLDVPFKI